MKRVPRISESEWQVMRVFWAKSPCTAKEVIDALEPVCHWQPKTIRTLINRLVGKKVLGFKKKGKAYLYYPVVEEQQCIRAERRSFLHRVYGGALMPMLAAFLEDEELSPEQIAELKRLLDGKKEE